MTIELRLDEKSVREAFQQAIADQLAAFIRQSTITEEVKAAIEKGFAKNWTTGRDNWLQENVQAGMNQAMWSAVGEAIKAAGIEDMIKSIVTEHVNTPEFKEALTRRTLQTVRETTFYVKPDPTDGQHGQ